MLIVVALGVLLRLEKTFVNLLKEGITITKQRVHGLCLGHPDGVGQQGRVRSTVDNLKWCGAKHRMK